MTEAPVAKPPVYNLPDGFRVACDPALFDFNRIHHWLCEKAYWSLGIPRATVEKAFLGSLSFALHSDADGQIGCARMVTDRATFAYLADVFIAEDHRGRGLAKGFLAHVMAHPDLQGLRRMMLTTSDMHPLYRHFGFTEPENPAIIMDRLAFRDYRQIKP